jgi:dolichol-phosphate mannosyltransferase
MTQTSKAQLTVFMPVYNESGIIGSVVKDWTAMLDSLGIEYVYRVYNDGSRDTTREVLDQMKGAYPRLEVIHKPNSGHGPTILQGYREARTEWVFQADSDDEMKPSHFVTLWQMRESYDFLLGARQERGGPLPRRIITFVARLIVVLLYGTGIHDMNSPFRLMRRAVLADIFDALPSDTFAPNVILSGVVNLRRLRTHEIPIPYEFRRTGVVSINKMKLLKAAARSMRQTITFRFASSVPLRTGQGPK